MNKCVFYSSLLNVAEIILFSVMDKVLFILNILNGQGSVIHISLVNTNVKQSDL